MSTRERTLEEEGFSHRSYGHQVAHVVGHVLPRCGQAGGPLVIDRQRVKAEIREESAGGDERFPYIYGPLNVDAVIEARPVG